MAKFGEKKEEYDPFGQISNSLSTLSKPAQPQEGSIPETEVETTLRSSSGVPDEPERTPRAAGIAESSGGVARRPAQGADRTVEPSVALKVTKRIKTTHDEALKLDQAAIRLAAHLGMSVDLSKITRALWEIYLRHEDEILRSMPDSAPSRRPANSDAVGLAELDERLAEMIGEGLMMASMRNRRRG